jgi:hypothetical protein
MQDDDLSLHVKQHNQLCSNMQVQFSDLLDTNIPDWMVEPFGEKAVDNALQEDVTAIQNGMLYDMIYMI